MCAIIGWSGKVPKGLMTKLFVESEHRGKDSTGVAFRTKDPQTGHPKNVAYRQAVEARVFVKENSERMGEARRSLRGIAHTRRASPGMPINNQNAHPFGFWKYFYAHNGSIKNWREIKDVLIEHYKKLTEEAFAKNDMEAFKSHSYYYTYCCGTSVVIEDGKLVYKPNPNHKGITTDSMVLGPYIDHRDFRSIVGCMALVWLKGENVYTFRWAKEAVVANVIWSYKEKTDDDEAGVDHMVTIVASTQKILEDAFAGIKDKVDFHMEVKEFEAGRVFRVEPTGLVDEGEVPVDRPVEDAFSSEIVDACAVTEDPSMVQGGELTDAEKAAAQAELRSTQETPGEGTQNAG